MQRASEMTIDQVEDVLRDMDWRAIHEARVFSDYGESVVLHTDGHFSTQGQNTYYRDPDAAGVIGYLKCWGGNIDRTEYAEGWTTPVEDGYLVNDDYPDPDLAGKVISEEAMLMEAIEQGDLDVDEEVEAILYNFKEERRYQQLLREDECG